MNTFVDSYGKRSLVQVEASNTERSQSHDQQIEHSENEPADSVSLNIYEHMVETMMALRSDFEDTNSLVIERESKSSNRHF